MVNISAWMDSFLQALKETFGLRVWFVGLQGSYGRGEATETSDIDAVVILDELSVLDIRAYNDMLDSLPHRELSCGFLCGKAELLAWDPSDLFQLCYDTTPILGSLEEALVLLDQAAINRAIKIGVCNIFHGCVHNLVHNKREDVLRGLYKSASFVVQAIAFKETGTYFRHQEDLLQAVSPAEQIIISTFLHLKKGGAADLQAMSETLFTWSKSWIEKIK